MTKTPTLLKRFEDSASVYAGALNPPDAIEETINWLQDQYDAETTIKGKLIITNLIEELENENVKTTIR